MSETVETKENHSAETAAKSEVADAVTDIIETNDKPESKKKRRVQVLEDGVVMIDNRHYTLAENYREAFDPELLDERYSDVLNRYDYIVGDIGFEQLRLKGFFSDYQKKTPQESRIGALQDYLYEYCNFGCAYYVLEKIGGKKEKMQSKEKPQVKNKRTNKKNKPSVKQQAFTEEKKGKPTRPPKNKNQPVIKNRKEETKSKEEIKETTQTKKSDGGNRSFTIRQKEEE